MEGLEKIEEAVLAMALAGDHPVLVALRKQAAEARLMDRELTGVGFFCRFSAPESAISGSPNFVISDVCAEIAGLEHGAGFALFISNGKLDMLEGFTYDEPWPERVEKFELTYRCEPRNLTIPAIPLQ